MIEYDWPEIEQKLELCIHSNIKPKKFSFKGTIRLRVDQSNFTITHGIQNPR